MNYGMKAKNPMDSVLFYEKGKTDETFLIPKEEVTVSQMLSSGTFNMFVRLTLFLFTDAGFPGVA